MKNIKQVIANPDGLGSYFACDIDGIFTNKEFSAQVKSIANMEFKSNRYWVFEILGSKDCILRAAQFSLDNALKYMNDENRVLVHKGPHFVHEEDAALEYNGYFAAHK